MMKKDEAPTPNASSENGSSQSTGPLPHTDSLAQAEDRAVNLLRIAVISVLVASAALMCTGVYLYTSSKEQNDFELTFEDSAEQVIDTFHGAIERNLGATAALSTDITSYALANNHSFPFVTLPNFAERGSHTRYLAGSHAVHFIPLIREEQRDDWEEYAYQHRSHIDEAFADDKKHRENQDALLGSGINRGRNLQANVTILDDESGYHMKIWRRPDMDEPEGGGVYLPLWQRSPINGARQKRLNLNVAPDLKRVGVLDKLLEGKAVMEDAYHPAPEILELFKSNLRLSQYREHVEDYVEGLSTFFNYPVFDSLDDNKKVVGMITSNVYWKNLFSNLLSPKSGGIVCVVQNSFNQTFSYRLDGPDATFLGMADLHDSKYDDLEMEANVNDHLRKRASPLNRAYGTSGLSDSTQYTIRVFPSRDMQDQFASNDPIVYTSLVLICYALVGALLLWFSYVVEKRHTIMTSQVIENAKQMAHTERHLNEFMAHEVRNPLSAAISATSFIASSLNEDEHLNNPATKKSIQEDLAVVNSSLNFINDFLRSAIDIHRATENSIEIEKCPADILHDVFEPVAAMQHSRVANFDLLVDCPENLIVMTDCVRVKQVVLNLVTNATNFVERGFIRMRADVVGGNVRLYIEDSGRGIQEDQKKQLFSKYQSSLDLMRQGSGLGLHLSKKLMQSMGGDLRLDESYNSGVKGAPGACFVVELNVGLLDMTEIQPTTGMEGSSEQLEILCETANGVLSPIQDGPSPPKPSQLFTAERNGVPGPGLTDSATAETSAEASDSFSVAKTPLFQVPIQNDPPPSSLAPKPESASCPATPPGASELDGEVEPQQLPNDLSILFVDDDAILRKLAQRACKKVGPSWKYKEASSGHAALRLCETESFDLIFMDQYMPSIEKQLLGTETVAMMRSQGIRSIICGLSANDIEEGFMNAGADYFKLKPMPCKPDPLKELLLLLLAKRNQQG